MFSLAYFWIFFLLLLVGMPVVFALLLAPGLSLVIDGRDAQFMSKLLSTVYSGMYSFPLMAVPFFILAGELMNSGGITKSIVRFSSSLIGHVRGGLAQVNILSSILFAGLSGSAVADTSALGKMLIPAMQHNGYSRSFSAAVTAASSVIGPIIPPSGIMILYAFVMNVSVAGLFLAGFVPGLMVGLGLMVLTWYLAKKRNYPVADRKATWGERGRALLITLPALLTPVILLGGILGGVMTPTEAAAIAAAYAILAAIVVGGRNWERLISPENKTDKISFGQYLKAMPGAVSDVGKTLPQVGISTALQAGIILLLVGAAVTFGWIVTVSGLAKEAAEFIQGVTDNPLLLLLFINILLFVVGMFLDAGPAILILGPVLSPIFVGELGLHPIHFAIIMCVNVTVGLATPPMGLVLFVASSVSGEKLEKIVVQILPFLAVEVIVIFLITYFPAISMTLPWLFGFAPTWEPPWMPVAAPAG
ncbi:MAG: TRAP transporter large permease [Pseudomonadota bacterium]